MCTYINRIIIEYVVGCGPDAISCDLLLLLSHSTIRYDNTAVRFFDLIIASSSLFLFSHDYKQFYDKLYRNVRGLRRQITKQRLLCAFETTNKFSVFAAFVRGVILCGSILIVSPMRAFCFVLLLREDIYRFVITRSISIIFFLWSCLREMSSEEQQLRYVITSI